MDDRSLLGVLSEAAAAVPPALARVDDWRRPGNRPGQYLIDLVADEAAVAVLHGAGLGVLSEESGISGAGGDGGGERAGSGRSGQDLLVVLDPVDGSTNASIGVPWYATSLCVLDGDGARVALVVNHATGTRYEAVRGGGARRDGRSLVPSGCRELGRAIVGVSGLPRGCPGWAQFRAFGSAALDHCAVAEGVLDGYLPAGGSWLHPWDYLGGMLVCMEAGAAVGELDGRTLLARDGSRRRPVAAATPELLAGLSSAGC